MEISQRVSELLSRHEIMMDRQKDGQTADGQDNYDRASDDFVRRSPKKECLALIGWQSRWIRFLCVLWPFQVHFTYIKPIVKNRWMETGAHEKPDRLESGFLNCAPRQARIYSNDRPCPEVIKIFYAQLS